MSSVCQIAWTATGITSHVRIRLLRADGGLVQVLEDDWLPEGSPYPWTVASPKI